MSNLYTEEVVSLSNKELRLYLDGLLKVHEINDFCPNGLQVEGKPQLKKIVTGVTASQALIDEAVKRNADAILVHHGYFWKGEAQPIVGMKKRRIKSILDNDLNLFASASAQLPCPCAVLTYTLILKLILIVKLALICP